MCLVVPSLGVVSHGSVCFVVPSLWVVSHGSVCLVVPSELGLVTVGPVGAVEDGMTENTFLNKHY